MPTPSGRTYHYGQRPAPEAGGPRILYRDGSGEYYRGNLPAGQPEALVGTVENTLQDAWNNVAGWTRRYPVASALVVLGAGYLLARRMMRYR
jgi:hypothetical protein